MFSLIKCYAITLVGPFESASTRQFENMIM